MDVSTSRLYLSGTTPEVYDAAARVKLVGMLDDIATIVIPSNQSASRSLLVSCSSEIVDGTISSIGGKISMDRLGCLAAAAMTLATKFTLEYDKPYPVQIYSAALRSMGSVCSVSDINEVERDMLRRSDWQGCRKALSAASDEVKSPASLPAFVDVSRPLETVTRDYTDDIKDYFFKEFGRCDSKHGSLLKSLWESGLPLKDDTLMSGYRQYNDARRKDGVITLINDIEYAIRFDEYIDVNGFREEEDSRGNVSFDGIQYVEVPASRAVPVKGWPSVYTTMKNSHGANEFTETMLNTDYPTQAILIRELTPVSISGPIDTFMEQVRDAMSKGHYIDVSYYDVAYIRGVSVYRVFSRKIPDNDYILLPGYTNIYYTGDDEERAERFKELFENSHVEALIPGVVSPQGLLGDDEDFVIPNL